MSSVLADQWRPLIRVQVRGDWEGGGGGEVSANEYSCAHHVTWRPNKLWRSTSIFNLWSSSLQGEQKFLFESRPGIVGGTPC
jgi:hypothetical protein